MNSERCFSLYPVYLEWDPFALHRIWGSPLVMSMRFSLPEMIITTKLFKKGWWLTADFESYYEWFLLWGTSPNIGIQRVSRRKSKGHSYNSPTPLLVQVCNYFHWNFIVLSPCGRTQSSYKSYKSLLTFAMILFGKVDYYVRLIDVEIGYQRDSVTHPSVKGTQEWSGMQNQVF